MPKKRPVKSGGGGRLRETCEGLDKGNRGVPVLASTRWERFDSGSSKLSDQSLLVMNAVCTPGTPNNHLKMDVW